MILKTPDLNALAKDLMRFAESIRMIERASAKFASRGVSEDAIREILGQTVYMLCLEWQEYQELRMLDPTLPNDPRFDDMDRMRRNFINQFATGMSIFCNSEPAYIRNVA